jgi:hypothetical protein
MACDSSAVTGDGGGADIVPVTFEFPVFKALQTFILFLFLSIKSVSESSTRENSRHNARSSVCSSVNGEQFSGWIFAAESRLTLSALRSIVSCGIVCILFITHGMLVI